MQMAGRFEWLTSRLVSRQSRQTRHFLGPWDPSIAKQGGVRSHLGANFFFPGKKKKSVWKGTPKSNRHTSYGAFGEH